MYCKQFYLGCLAHASSLIGADGEAAVVAPQRDVEQYLQEAAAHGFQIKYISETHLHADFVSGHRARATRTGADMVFGHRAGATFPHRAVHERCWWHECMDQCRLRCRHRLCQQMRGSLTTVGSLSQAPRA